MRLFPILAAILVIAAIYAFVFERDRVLALLPQPDATEEAVADEAPAPAEDKGAGDDPAAGEPAVSVVAVHSKARRSTWSSMARPNMTISVG